MSMSDLAIVTRSLRSRLFSSLVTGLMVAVSVALMLVLLNLRDAARDHFTRGTGNAEFLVSNEPSAFVSVLNAFFYTGSPAGPVDASVLERFQDDEFRRFFRFAIPLQMGDSYRGRPVVATNPSFFRFFEPVVGQPFALAQGRVFSGTFEVVAGSDAAKTFSLSLGETIVLTHGSARDPNAHAHSEFEFTVVGILSPTGTAHDRALFTTLDASWVLHAHDRRLDGAQSRGQSTETVSLTTEADLTDADRKLTGILLATNRLSAFSEAGYILRTETGLTVANPATEIRRFESLLSGVDDLFIAVVGVVMVSSALAIMLALYNSMDLRRRQIAMLRVFGCSAGRVFSLVVTEAAFIGLGGGLAGVALGLIGGELARSVLREQVGLVLSPHTDPVVLLGLVIAATGLAALAGVVPAVKAYATPVASGLRPLA